MEFTVALIIAVIIVYFILRPTITGQIAAAKIVEQQHSVASDELITGVLEHAISVGKLHQARELFDDVRKKQGDGTIRVGQAAWVMMKIIEDINEEPPIY